MTPDTVPHPLDPPVVAVPTAEAPSPRPVPAPPASETAAPARRRFRLLRAYAAALRVALSYLWFDGMARLRGEAPTGVRGEGEDDAREAMRQLRETGWVLNTSEVTVEALAAEMVAADLAIAHAQPEVA